MWGEAVAPLPAAPPPAAPPPAASDEAARSEKMFSQFQNPQPTKTTYLLFKNKGLSKQYLFIKKVHI